MSEGVVVVSLLRVILQPPGYPYLVWVCGVPSALHGQVQEGPNNAPFGQAVGEHDPGVYLD